MVSLDPIDLPLSVTINGTTFQNYIVPADNSSLGRVVQSQVYPAAYSPNVCYGFSSIKPLLVEYDFKFHTNADGY